MIAVAGRRAYAIGSALANPAKPSALEPES